MYNNLSFLADLNTTRNNKCTIYKMLLRPILTYASETWTISKQDEEQLIIFE